MFAMRHRSMPEEAFPLKLFRVCSTAGRVDSACLLDMHPLSLLTMLIDVASRKSSEHPVYESWNMAVFTIAPKVRIFAWLTVAMCLLSMTAVMLAQFLYPINNLNAGPSLLMQNTLTLWALLVPTMIPAIIALAVTSMRTRRGRDAGKGLLVTMIMFAVIAVMVNVVVDYLWVLYDILPQNLRISY